jgi:AMP-polyphosphate phosphotransferase
MATHSSSVAEQKNETPANISSNKNFKEDITLLRQGLLQVQFELNKRKDFSVIIIIAGLEGSGKVSVLNKLTEWMDPRLLDTLALKASKPGCGRHPLMWEYWQNVPARGRIGIFLGAWYIDPVTKRINEEFSAHDFEQVMADICAFEKMMDSENVLILKYWLDFNRAQQKSRIDELSKQSITKWRISSADKMLLKRYKKIAHVFDQMLVTSSSESAPWHTIKCDDTKLREYQVGRSVLEAITDKLRSEPSPNMGLAPFKTNPNGTLLLNNLDLSQKIDKKEYKKTILALQEELSGLTSSKFFQNISVVCIFEGPDAAGKGGAIRRITSAVDARILKVIPISAPTDEEKVHPYLWRFWRKLPHSGQFNIFDRSWYGRVLVERVEQFCSKHDWARAYDEINHLERQLHNNNVLVIKFWLHISKEEQEKRFEERKLIPHKQFKLTEEDWRNRQKWEDYEHAACDMMFYTHSNQAPWIVIEANDKYFARVKVLEVLCHHIRTFIQSKKPIDKQHG